MRAVVSPIRYMKAAPTTYVIHYQGGKLAHEGAGLAFFYWAPSAVLITVPLASRDVPFIFNQVTADYQPVAVQGQLSHRVADPRRLAALLDYSIRPDGSFASDDPEQLGERLLRMAQVAMQDAAQRRTLADALVSSEALGRETLAALRGAEAVSRLGIEVLDLTVLSVKPTPETARAIEAEAREALQRRADEAIYARRNAAVEQERRIKESELATEVAVAQKQREIRETQMATDIAMEEQRARLVEQRAGNDRMDADARAYALRATLEPLRATDWRTLMAVSAGGADPKLMIALAFRELAENAQKIGELNMTPDLLQSLVKTEKR